MNTSVSHVPGEIRDVLQTYFDGLHRGDVDALRRVFHPHAALFGEIRGQPYQKSLSDYLQIVAARASPQALGETFRMAILSVDVVGSIACAKVHCPMLGQNYIDFLSLVRSDDRWVVVNKTFTHIDA
ncbi:MAG: nuclear transport factor 2 family protein [Tahibacter sp.]